jgi:hypothetical protein
MFQYAAGRALASRLGVPLKLDVSWFVCKKSRSYALAPFLISGMLCDSSEFLPDFLRFVWNRVAHRLAWRRMGLPVFRERHFHFDASLKMLGHPVYLDGYWQSELYFSECRDVLMRNFLLRDDPPENCRALMDRMATVDAICVHVRRGDYVSNRLTADVHGLCTMDYYQTGLSLVAKGLATPHCFIFSDDPEWVRARFSLQLPMTIVDINQPEDAHWDLHLMSCCRHFVIANSSLSWWGAWLGRDPSKRVVAPAKWFQNSPHDTRNLIPETWERV